MIFAKFHDQNRVFFVTFVIDVAHGHYSCIFVSIFKIFHLRPARRLLLLEAETLAEESQAAAEANLLTHS